MKTRPDTRSFSRRGSRFLAVVLCLGGLARGATWQGDIDTSWFGGTLGVDTNWNDHTFALTGGQTINSGHVVADSAAANAASLGIVLTMSNSATDSTLTLKGSQSMSTAGTTRIAQQANGATATINLDDNSSWTVTGIARFGENAFGVVNLNDSATLTVTGGNSGGRLDVSSGATGVATINLISGSYDTTGKSGTGSDLLNYGNGGSVTIAIGQASVSAFGWQLNNGDTTLVSVTGGSSLAPAERITFSKTSNNALQLNNANTTLELNLDSYAAGGVRQWYVTGSNALLASMNLVINPLAGFAIDAGQYFDVLYASGSSTLAGIDIADASGLTSFVDTTGAAFALSIVLGPGNGGRERWLRLTATETVGAIPEPASALLLGLLGLAACRRRR